MSEKIILSIIVPIYNGEQYLELLIKRIAKQNLPSFEVILVDDGSSDGTYEKCKNYMKKYTWIQVLHTENKGVSHARNLGIKVASGEWIQFLDVDDIIHKDMFSDFYKNVQKENVEVVICSCIRKDWETKTIAKCGPQKDEILDTNAWNKMFWDMQLEVRYWFLDYVWNKWYRREIIEEKQIQFDESLSLGEDFVFNTCYFQYVKKAILLEKAYYKYVVGENGLTSRFYKEPWIGSKKLYEAHKNLYASLGILDLQKRTIDLQAGRIEFFNIRTINRKSCLCTNRQKKQFVQNMIKSEQFPMLLYYLKSQKRVCFQIYYMVCLTRNASLLTMLIRMEKLIQNFKNIMK